MAIKEGTKVVIVGGGPTAASGNYHEFHIGTSAIATGEVYSLNPVWQRFKDKAGTTTWLKAEHYKVVEEVVVDKSVPSKVIYGILKNGEVVATHFDRETARNVKAILGGKASGVTLFAYTATKEIR